MTFAPAPLLQAHHYLRSRTGLPAVSLGIVGGPSHRGGYHLGWDRLRQHQGGNDYSVRESSRDRSPTNAASALDIGGFGRLRELSAWIVARCQAGTVDTRDIREVIWSPDGRVVRRWDRLGIRSTGDASHLTHTHISYFRDSERRDKVGLFRRFFEPQQEEDDMPSVDEIARAVWLWRSGITERQMGAHLRAADRAAERAAADAARSAELAQAALAAVSGADLSTILARVDQHHAEQVARLDTLSAELEQATAERTALVDLLEQHASGELAAEAVVDELARRLAPAAEDGA